MSARLGPSWGTSMSQGGIGSATGLVDRQPVWQLRLPSLSTALLAAAVLLLIALQVAPHALLRSTDTLAASQALQCCRLRPEI